MVLEHLFPGKWIEHRLKYLFLITIVYTAISLIVSTIIFPKNSGIVSVILLSLLLMPYIKKAIREEERKELKERKFNFWHLWNDNKDIIKVYLTIFLGIYFSYLIFCTFTSYLGLDITSIFKEQLNLETNLRGGAYKASFFFNIFLNNWWVLLVCFLFGLLAGDAALFFVAWNASSWGSIFAFRAILAAESGLNSILLNLGLLLLITFPHMVLESLAYILASVSGSEVSYDIISKKKFTKLFVIFFTSMIFFLIILYWILFKIFPPFQAHLIAIVFTSLLIYALSYLFDDEKHKEAFKYAYYLFLLAVLIFIIGAFVEVLVVGNSKILYSIYSVVG